MASGGVGRGGPSASASFRTQQAAAGAAAARFANANAARLSRSRRSDVARANNVVATGFSAAIAQGRVDAARRRR